MSAQLGKLLSDALLLPGDRGNSRVVRACAQHDALEARRRVADGEDIAALQQDRRFNDPVADLRVRGRLVVGCGGGAGGILQLRQPLLELRDLPLSGLCVGAAVAHGDHLPGGGFLSLREGKRGDAAVHRQHGLVPNDVTVGVVAAAGSIARRLNRVDRRLQPAQNAGGDVDCRQRHEQDADQRKVCLSVFAERDQFRGPQEDVSLFSHKGFPFRAPPGGLRQSIRSASEGMMVEIACL